MSDTSKKIIGLKDYMETQIIGQEDLIKKLFMALLADGHVLVEGAPGLAKTKAIKLLASMISGEYNRIQFTPDLLPSDITGSEIYVAQKSQFEFRQGPVFANLVLADEINRSPAKVQSALLEAMAERQVSYNSKKYELPDLFMVMATQNPIEHEGTYNLPEAQLDRFLLYVRIGQPTLDAERKILEIMRRDAGIACADDASCWVDTNKKPKVIKIDDIMAARQEVLLVHMSEALEEYLLQLVIATREPGRYDEDLARLISFGASPRATFALDVCAKINAWLEGREFVVPEDIHAVVKDALRHRIILSFEAQAENITTDDVIDKILKIVPLP